MYLRNYWWLTLLRLGAHEGLDYRGELQYQWVAKAQNVSGAVNAACAAAHTGEDAWKCFMAQYTLPFIKTPYFIVNSFYDAWQWGAILAMPCGPGPPAKRGPAPRAPKHSHRASERARRSRRRVMF